MDWANERYVRVYTRDTGDWLLWPWQTRALLLFLFRKVDRSGVLHLGKGKLRALGAMVGMPEDELAQALEPLTDDGCVQLREDKLIIPNFIKAQETPQSDKLRKQESRERAREEAMGHAPSQPVTPSPSGSREVTPIRSEPSQAKPVDSAGALDGERSPKTRKGTRLPDDWTPTRDEAFAKVLRQTQTAEADVPGIVDEFRDFWQAEPGQRGCKLSWDATFRNRLRKLASIRRRTQPQSGKFRSTPPPAIRTYREFSDEPGPAPLPLGEVLARAGQAKAAGGKS